MDSILNSVKDYLGIQAADTAFDTELTMHINAIMFVLKQLGIGPETPFRVTNSTQTWSDLMGDVPYDEVRLYVQLRVKKLFDPSTNNQLMDALKEEIDQAEWRLKVMADSAYYAAREV